MSTPETTRRSFYVVLIQALGAMIGAALAVPAGVYLLFKPKVQKEAQWVQAADVAQLQVRKPEEVVFRRTRVDGWRTVNEKTTAWVVRMDDQNVVAFTPNAPISAARTTGMSSRNIFSARATRRRFRSTAR